MDYGVRQSSGVFGAKGTLLADVGEAEAGICVKRGQTDQTQSLIKLRSLSFRQVIRRTSAELPGSVKRQKAELHVILQPGNMFI